MEISTASARTESGTSHGLSTGVAAYAQARPRWCAQTRHPTGFGDGALVARRRHRRPRYFGVTSTVAALALAATMGGR